MLAQRINSCFSKLIALVHEYNGEVFKFCGDGLIAIWPVNDTFKTTEEHPGCNMKCAVRKAFECAMAIQRMLPSTIR